LTLISSYGKNKLVLAEDSGRFLIFKKLNFQPR
jgi:hypothetical protein